MKLTKFNNTKQKLLLLVPMYVPFESFVNPLIMEGVTRKDGKKYNSLSTDIPLGPISLSAYLKKHIDIDVKLIDFNVELNHADSFHLKIFVTTAMISFRILISSLIMLAFHLCFLHPFITSLIVERLLKPYGLMQ